MNDRPQQPTWFYWFFAGYAALMMIPFGYLVFDFITHPLAPEAAYGSVAYRLLTALVIVPVCLIGSVLVLRRARGNVIGLFLLSLAAYSMVATVRLDAPVSKENFNFHWVPRSGCSRCSSRTVNPRPSALATGYVCSQLSTRQ